LVGPGSDGIAGLREGGACDEGEEENERFGHCGSVVGVVLG
jgi:hypothetical protein